MWEVINDFICGILLTIDTFIFGKITLKQEIKISKLKILILSLVTSIFLTLTYLGLESTTKTLLMASIETIYYIQLFQISVKKSIFVSIIFIVVLMLTDLVDLLFVTEVLKLNSNLLYGHYAGSVFGNTIITISFTILVYILKKPLRKLINNKITLNTKITVKKSKNK